MEVMASAPPTYSCCHPLRCLPGCSSGCHSVILISKTDVAYGVKLCCPDCVFFNVFHVKHLECLLCLKYSYLTLFWQVHFFPHTEISRRLQDEFTVKVIYVLRRFLSHLFMHKKQLTCNKHCISRLFCDKCTVM